MEEKYCLNKSHYLYFTLFIPVTDLFFTLVILKEKILKCYINMVIFLIFVLVIFSRYISYIIPYVNIYRFYKNLFLFLEYVRTNKLCYYL